MIAGGGIGLAAEQSIQTLDSAAEGRTPGSVRFTAEARKYNVLLGSEVNSSIANDARCEARLADGTVKRMRGDRQGVAVNGVAATIGAFEAVAGETTVACG